MYCWKTFNQLLIKELKTWKNQKTQPKNHQDKFKCFKNNWEKLRNKFKSRKKSMLQLSPMISMNFNQQSITNKKNLKNYKNNFNNKNKSQTIKKPLKTKMSLLCKKAFKNWSTFLIYSDKKHKSNKSRLALLDRTERKRFSKWQRIFKESWNKNNKSWLNWKKQSVKINRVRSQLKEPNKELKITVVVKLCD